MPCCWSGLLLHAKSAVTRTVVVPCLCNALQHESEEVRACAIRCLENIPKETISPDLVQVMLRSRHPKMRTAGVCILPHISQDSVPKHLMALALHHNDPHVRTAGLRYLCHANHAGRPRELAVFWLAHAASNTPTVRSETLHSSSKRRQSTMQDQIHIDLVKMAFKHNDEVVRAAAIQYLKILPQEQLPPELVRYTILHTSLAVRMAGAQCLRRLPSEKSPRDLQQACFWDMSPASGAKVG
mmetsp:Transcript_38889/g.77172  ORF Transcript_38889/g.77172 Transcript_38889/m.77172 type:complete len:241 (+) Transcript_38889:58-780(+)